MQESDMLIGDSWPIGVCSWSLQADVDVVAEVMSALGIEHVHLAIRPALTDDGEKYLADVKEQSWIVSSTMIDFPQEDYSTLESIRTTGGVVPDDCWPQNRELFRAAADMTETLDVICLSMHAGFIDPTRPQQARKLAGRIRCLADMSAEKGIMLLMETGQETAEELRRFLEDLDHPAVGVNFDPANMILYDKGDPMEALRILSPWIRHVHIKDAVRTETPGTWGTEIPWGDGDVGDKLFLSMLREIEYDGALEIERESGDDRIGDIARAVDRLRQFK